MIRRIVLGATLAAVLGSLLTVLAAPVPAAALPSCGEARLLDLGNRVSALIPVVTGTTNYKCVLGKPQHNWGVVVLQISLKECEGQSGLDVDGIYGDQTAGAVRNVQAKYGISRDGVYGPQTLSVMRWRGSFPGATGPVPICTLF
jgi:peptidoglycan hydrolase-like protein with peptidoglycan-binding domain